MKLYRFKTFRTSYYFPRINEELEYLYGLYAAYGGKLSKFYWWLFRNCEVVRRLNQVDSSKVEFPFSDISEFEGKGSLMAFNLGTPGSEQKISILGFNQKEKLRFFAKYSEKKAAMELTKNEIAVYNLLGETCLTPTIFDTKVSENFVWMKTSYVDGSHYSTMELTQEVVNLALVLSQYHLPEKSSNEKGLLTCLSHGDFCPWNMLVNDGKIKLIDWEMAAERPLGYDIFKYVCQCSRLFHPNKAYSSVIKENKTLIDLYFFKLGIKNWEAYYEYFSQYGVL